MVPEDCEEILKTLRYYADPEHWKLKLGVNDKLEPESVMPCCYFDDRGYLAKKCLDRVEHQLQHAGEFSHKASFNDGIDRAIAIVRQLNLDPIAIIEHRENDYARIVRLKDVSELPHGTRLYAHLPATAWRCKANRSGVGGNDPQDCSWPTCGCDPHADKVIAALQEGGML